MAAGMDLTPLDDPERQLSLAYAAPADRRALHALWSLDATFGATLAHARDPMTARLRLAWWSEALERLGTAPLADAAPPLLRMIAAELLPRGVDGAALAGMIDGWELLLDPDPLSDDDLRRYAEARGSLFTLAAVALGGGQAPVVAAGLGWALADLAGRVRDDALAVRARALAAPLLAEGLAAGWPRRLRALGMVALLARADLARPDRRRGAPGRVAAMLRFGAFGR